MKKIVTNVVSFVLIVMIMAAMSRITITTVTYDNQHLCGDGWAHADMTVRETKFICGEVVEETVHNDVQWWANGNIGEFLSDRSHHGTKIISIGFR